MTLAVRNVQAPVARDEALVAALEALPWLPYRRYFGLETDAAVRGACASLDAAAERDPGEGRVLAVHDSGEVVGAAALTLQAFDTEIFGHRMARSAFAFVRPGSANEGAAADALLDGIEDVCGSWDIDHLSLMVGADDVALTYGAVRRGWFLADSTLDYTWEVAREETRRGACTPDVTVRAGTPADAEVLAEMTYRVYTTSIRTRYATDPWLPLDGVGRLYARWAENACLGTFADAVAVAEVDGEIVGYDMLKLNPRLSEALGVGFANKGLAATTPAARGKRVMSCVDGFLNQWQYERGGHFNTGRVLINNIPMQKACAKIGGVATAAFHTFHAWLGPRVPASGEARS